MEAIAASAGTLAIVIGYVIVKRCRNSECQADSGCFKITSPALELAKKHTERLEKQDFKLEQILIMLAGDNGPELLTSLKEGPVEESKVTTTSIV
jgi:hypothetical protein